MREGIWLIRKIAFISVSPEKLVGIHKGKRVLQTILVIRCLYFLSTTFFCGACGEKKIHELFHFHKIE